MTRRRSSSSNLDIKGIWTDNMTDIRRWQPADPKHFCQLVVLAIGQSRKVEHEYFTICVASPSGIAAYDDGTSGPIIIGPHLLVMRYWDVDALCDWLEERVHMCTSDSWLLAVDRLRRHFGHSGG